MLLAEIHGKAIPEAANSEDYLTSTVFGHLRYVSIAEFWHELLQHAIAMPRAPAKTLVEDLAGRGIFFRDLESVEVRFWPSHPTYGCPDLILVFTLRNSGQFVLIVEAKLWASKSGTGEFDQIARYLRMLSHPEGVKPPLPRQFSSALIYLTEHDGLAELENSVNAYEDPDEARKRIFRLQWQDILVAARNVLPAATATTKLILEDVAKFLSRRGLEYFAGFHQRTLPTIQMHKLGDFGQKLFSLFPLSIFQIRPLLNSAPQAFWVHADLPEKFHKFKARWVR